MDNEDSAPTVVDPSDIPRSSFEKNFVRSPYLDYDPRYVYKPEYILPEGAPKQRGRFELAFAQIGTSCVIGAAIGGINGYFIGLKQTAIEGQTGALKRTQLLNHIMKQGAAHGNSLGVLTLMYSGFGVILSWVRGVDDEFNTIAAGTATGLIYKSTCGMKKCGIAGAVGFSIASLYCILTSLASRDRREEIVST